LSKRESSPQQRADAMRKKHNSKKRSQKKERNTRAGKRKPGEKKRKGTGSPAIQPGPKAATPKIAIENGKERKEQKKGTRGFMETFDVRSRFHGERCQVKKRGVGKPRKGGSASLPTWNRSNFSGSYRWPP